MALLYLDDILVPGRTFRQQMDNLQMVFCRLREAHLKLNPRQCNLFQKEVKYLGHVVSAKGVSPDLEKVEAIQAWPRPMSSKDLQSFLGLASYYRRFIPGFTDIAVPLHHCAKKMTTFVWSIEEETAFTKLKTALSKAPVLAYPDPALPFLLDTDASSTGIGAVLSQVTKGKETYKQQQTTSLNTTWQPQSHKAKLIQKEDELERTKRMHKRSQQLAAISPREPSGTNILCNTARSKTTPTWLST